MLTSRQAKRIKAVAVAVALVSWILPTAIVLVAVPPSRPIGIAGLAVCAVSLVVSLLLAWSLYCPWCCERLFFVTSIFNSPSCRQLMRQYVPYEVVVNSRFTCPHCHSRFALANQQRQPPKASV